MPTLPSNEFVFLRMKRKEKKNPEIKLIIRKKERTNTRKKERTNGLAV